MEGGLLLFVGPFPFLVAVEKSVDALAMVYLILLIPIPFFWLLIHPAIHFWRRFGKRSLWVALPVWLLFAAGLLLVRNQLLAARIHRNAGTWTAGLFLLALTIWIERQTRRAFGLRRLAGLPELSPRHHLSGLVCTGVYARLRHPRYVQYMLTIVSMAFLTGAVGIFLLAILNILLYQIVAPLEERELLEHYGPQYEAYACAVPRFAPRLRRRIEPQISS